MRASHLAKAARDLEQAASLIGEALDALSAWDPTFEGLEERRAASQLYYRALALRLLLETEVREKVLH